MRKIGTIFVIGLLLVGFAFAGGIVTNTNQSADFIRLMNRNASTDVDAVYFNPAGLTLLNEGFSFYLSSQTVLQDRIVKSDVPTLISDTFNGETFVPVFPNFYVAYKTGNLAFGAGFTPIGGGGSAVFDDGLPSFAVPVSLVPVGLTAAGIPTTKYSMDVEFDGSSTYLGGQAVVSYKINDMISVAGGARFFAATNAYKGHLKNIMIDPTYPGLFDGSMTSAPGFFTTMADALTAGASQALGGANAYADGSSQAAAGALAAQGGATGLQPLIDGGVGGLTFDQLIGLGAIDQATVAGIGAGVVALGGTFDSSTDTPAGTQAFFSGTSTYLNGLATVYADSSAYYTVYAGQLSESADAMSEKADATQDLEVDTEATGSGFAPIFGLYLSPMEGLDIGIRYEGKAAMELEYAGEKDGGLANFKDGRIQNADMPAMIGAGIAYKVIPSLRIVADFNYYFNKDVNWDGDEDDLDNGTEIGVGADFAVSDALRLSAGFLSGKSGAKIGYQTDLSHTFDTFTIGGGGRYYINPNLYLSFGISSTTYEDIKNDGVKYYSGTEVLTTGNETYDKTALDFAIGIGFSR